MNISDVTSMLLTKNLTMADKGIASAKVILTGFVVVFAVLILLIIIIKIYSSVLQKAQGGKKKKDSKNSSNETKAQSNSAPVAVSKQAVASDTVPEEVVAVISAAVSTIYGSPNKARIKSISKSSQGRSAWANAGVLNNTRPF